MDAEKVTNRKNMEKVAVVLLKAREIIPEEKNKVRKIEKKYNSKDKEKCLRMDKRFLKQIQKCQKEGTKVFREIKTKKKTACHYRKLTVFPFISNGNNSLGTKWRLTLL